MPTLVVGMGRWSQLMPTTSVGMAPNAVNARAVLADAKELVFQDFEPPVRLWFFHKLS